MICDDSLQQMEFTQFKRRTRGFKMLKKTNKPQTNNKKPGGISTSAAVGQVMGHDPEILEELLEVTLQRHGSDSEDSLVESKCPKSHYIPQRPCSRLPAGVCKSLIGVLMSPDFTHDISHDSLK